MKSALVVEGGAMRGIFAAGLIWCLVCLRVQQMQRVT